MLRWFCHVQRRNREDDLGSVRHIADDYRWKQSYAFALFENWQFIYKALAFGSSKFDSIIGIKCISNVFQINLKSDHKSAFFICGI